MELAPESRLISEAIAASSERARWKRIAALHERGAREAFDAAVVLASSRFSDERRLGADVLGQLGFRDVVKPDGTIDYETRQIHTTGVPRTERATTGAEP